METGEIYVCGGGAYNSYLLEQLRWRLRKHNWSVQPTDVLGLSLLGSRLQHLHG